MLNELHDLAECLKSVQVPMTSWHRHFKECPKSATTFLALLDAAGRVVELEPISDRERIASMRKWEVENGVSFPGFNVPPLYEPESDEAKKFAAELRKALASKSRPGVQETLRRIEELLGRSGSLWINKEATRINKCVGTHAEKLGNALGPAPPDFRAITELISRATGLSSETLQHQLHELLTRRITASTATAAAWFDVLFFHSGKAPKKVSLILELADRSQFRYPANHEAVQAWVNAQLQSASESESQVGDSSLSAETDAYAASATHLADKFPKVRLPVLGDVILRSMSSESPCQRRYGVVDGSSCPVGAVSRTRMKSALEWLGDPKRRDRTWADARGTCGYTRRGGKKIPVPAVLFAYPSRVPNVCPEIAGLLAGIDDTGDPEGGRFEQYAAPVASALQGVIRTHPETEIRVFVLMKADKARTKVVQSRCFAASHLLNSASEWQECARNIPVVKIRRFGAKDRDAPFWANPLTPFPTEVTSCLNTAWERAGTHAEPVPGFAIGDGLGLLLERGAALRVIALRGIRTLVAKSLSLALALGHAHHQGLVHRVGKSYGKHPLLLPSILGLLLAKLGRWKGEYMKGPPFLVGRLLSLADQLHVQYCYGVRKGQIPPQLLGTALMATALEQPTKALAVLAQRIMPYKAWATTVQGGENIGLTKYLLGEIGRVTKELAGTDLPSKCTDTDKAEMLLGYLARSEKDKDTETTSTISPQGAGA